jgi:hypothetical protein
MEQLKSGGNTPLIMPGPKFEETGWFSKIKNFLKNNSQNIALLIIGLAIISGGIYLYSNYQKSNLALNPEEQKQEENQKGVIKPEQINVNQNQNQNQPGGKNIQPLPNEKAEVTGSNQTSIVVKAKKGA